jgi:Ca2+-dependent lipid-binding protein
VTRSSLNDELVYKTRVKTLSSSPVFNAGTERFVRDWRVAHVTVSVRDARKRENDPILGLVVLKVVIFPFLHTFYLTNGLYC